MRYKIERDMEFFWPGSTGTFLISAVMWAESEVFLLELPHGSTWPGSQARVGLFLGHWAQDSPSRCTRCWSGSDPGMPNNSHQGKQSPIILKVVSMTSGCVVRNGEVVQESFRCRKSSCLSKYPAEFLLENNLMCKTVSFPHYEGWDLREKCLILQT